MKHKRRNIVLIGFMGSGKTTLGLKLSYLLRMALEQYGNDVISFVTQKSSDAHQSAIWYRLFG